MDVARLDLRAVWQNASPNPEAVQIGSSMSRDEVMVIIYSLTIFINKELIRYIMDASGTPHDSEPCTLEFEGRILTLSEPLTGKISISFDDMTQKFRFQSKNYNLQKVNFKSVLAGVKGTHPQIISAKFQKTEKGEESLVVKVSYEFLPEIVEKIVFEKVEIPAEESQQAMVRGMRTFIRGIRQQLNSLGSVQILSGAYDETTDTQIFVKLNHRKTIFTWASTFKNMSNNIVKIQLYYYNSTTKQRKSTGAVPQEGIYIHNSGTGYAEVKFLVELEDYDMVIFSHTGKAKGEYTIASEKVEML